MATHNTTKGLDEIRVNLPFSRGTWEKMPGRQMRARPFLYDLILPLPLTCYAPGEE